ncbi:MAG: nuclear transport factor 2 family protein [Gammaproteobacteria bacterium]
MLKQYYLSSLAILTICAGSLVALSAQAAEPAVISDYSQASWGEDQRTVWQVIVRWNRAFAENDVERYFEFIDQNITVLTPGNPYRVEGIIDDRNEFEFGLSTGRSEVGFFQMMQPLIRVFGDMAIVTYFSRGYYGSDNGNILYFKETDVLALQDGNWKIVHIHLSE